MCLFNTRPCDPASLLRHRICRKVAFWIQNVIFQHAIHVLYLLRPSHRISFHGYIPDTAARKRRSKMDKKKVNCVPVIGVLWSFSLIVFITTFHCDGIIFITSILGGGTGRTIFVTTTGILCGGIDLSLQDHPASPSGSFSSRPFSGEVSTSGVTAP